MVNVYTVANAVNHGLLPSGLELPAGVTWDETQLVIADTQGDELWTLSRNANGSYTPANAVNQGTFTNRVRRP